jgi:hypothetical protein
VGVFMSDALGAFGTQQVGWTHRTGQTRRASLWHGTAASWVELHPAAATGESRALATTGYLQVGFAIVGANRRPSLWRGTAASWIDLTPADAHSGTAAGAHGEHQVGWVEISGYGRASLWSGTAGSWVDLHPLGATASQANGVDGDLQVGSVIRDGVWRAGHWRGTSASWQALPLPAGEWLHTMAQSVWRDGTTTYIVGQGENMNPRRGEALLWIGRAPAPAAVSGTLGLSGWTAPLTDPLITFEIREPGSTTALQTAVASLSATGEFTFTTALPAGTYDVTAKSDRWLRARLQNVTFTATGASGLAFGDLIPGDVVENNVIDLADFLALAATYEVSPPTEARADLNGDGAVDLADFLLLAAHYETVGAP